MKDISEGYNNDIKGHVKIELFDEDGNIFDTIENHNVVVNDATDLIAASLADPSGYSVVEMKFEEDTEVISASTDHKMFKLKNPLPYAKGERKKFSISIDELRDSQKGAGKNVIKVPGGYTPVDSIKNAVLKSSDSDLRKYLDTDIELFVKDKEEGTIAFTKDLKELADDEEYDEVEFDLYQVQNRSVGIIEGSQEVTIAGTEFKISNNTDMYGDRIAKDEYYGIDYKTGDIWFDEVKEGVAVKYKYKVINGINYMGIGNKPNSHPAGYPVNLTDDHAHLSELRREHEGARQPLIFPAKITRGSTARVSRQGDGEQEKFYIPSQYTPLIEINEVTVYEDDGTALNYVPVDEFTLEEVEEEDSDSESDEEEEERSLCENRREVKIIDKGGEEDQAVVRFHPAPPASEMRNVRIDFRWDSGATVNFVAEFDPFTPQPQRRESLEVFTAEKEQLRYLVDNEILNILAVKVDSNDITDQANYNENNRKEVVLDTTPMEGQNVEIEYEYVQEVFDIYEVGLFNGAHEDSLMFSISGIGPVSKDQNTGMRITWSITF